MSAMENASEFSVASDRRVTLAGPYPRGWEPVSAYESKRFAKFQRTRALGTYVMLLALAGSIGPSWAGAGGDRVPYHYVDTNDEHFLESFVRENPDVVTIVRVAPKRHPWAAAARSLLLAWVLSLIVGRIGPDGKANKKQKISKKEEKADKKKNDPNSEIKVLDLGGAKKRWDEVGTPSHVSVHFKNPNPRDVANVTMHQHTSCTCACPGRCAGCSQQFDAVVSVHSVYYPGVRDELVSWRDSGVPCYVIMDDCWFGMVDGEIRAGHRDQIVVQRAGQSLYVYVDDPTGKPDHVHPLVDDWYRDGFGSYSLRFVRQCGDSSLYLLEQTPAAVATAPARPDRAPAIVTRYASEEVIRETYDRVMRVAPDDRLRTLHACAAAVAARSHVPVECIRVFTETYMNYVDSLTSAGVGRFVPTVKSLAVDQPLQSFYRGSGGFPAFAIVAAFLAQIRLRNLPKVLPWLALAFAMFALPVATAQQVPSILDPNTPEFNATEWRENTTRSLMEFYSAAVAYVPAVGAYWGFLTPLHHAQWGFIPVLLIMVVVLAVPHRVQIAAALAATEHLILGLLSLYFGGDAEHPAYVFGMVVALWGAIEAVASVLMRPTALTKMFLVVRYSLITTLARGVVRGYIPGMMAVVLHMSWDAAMALVGHWELMFGLAEILCRLNYFAGSGMGGPYIQFDQLDVVTAEYMGALLMLTSRDCYEYDPSWRARGVAKMASKRMLRGLPCVRIYKELPPPLHPPAHRADPRPRVVLGYIRAYPPAFIAPDLVGAMSCRWGGEPRDESIEYCRYLRGMETILREADVDIYQREPLRPFSVEVRDARLPEGTKENLLRSFGKVLGTSVKQIATLPITAMTKMREFVMSKTPVEAAPDVTTYLELDEVKKNRVICPQPDLHAAILLSPVCAVERFLCRVCHLTSRYVLAHQYNLLELGVIHTQAVDAGVGWVLELDGVDFDANQREAAQKFFLHAILTFVEMATYEFPIAFLAALYVNPLLVRIADRVFAIWAEASGRRDTTTANGLRNLTNAARAHMVVPLWRALAAGDDALWYLRYGLPQRAGLDAVAKELQETGHKFTGGLKPITTASFCSKLAWPIEPVATRFGTTRYWWGPLIGRATYKLGATFLDGRDSRVAATMCQNLRGLLPWYSVVPILRVIIQAYIRAATTIAAGARPIVSEFEAWRWEFGSALGGQALKPREDAAWELMDAYYGRADWRGREADLAQDLANAAPPFVLDQAWWVEIMEAEERNGIEMSIA